MNLELPMLIAAAQLTDAYIRWLAFSSKVSEEVKRRLWARSICWGVASVGLYYLLFETFTICATTYKLVLMLGWLPYFLIAVRLIPWGLPQHLFVFGMGVICSLVQHTVCALIILKYFGAADEADLILIEALGYLLLFAVFLPICGACFMKLLPSREFFDLRPIGIYIAVLPLVIVSGHVIRLIDDVFVHSEAERLSRLYLPVVFFFFYRYILQAAQSLYDLQRLERNKHRLEEQLAALTEYNALIRDNQKQVAIMRHDLRHSYNLIYAMLESGNVAKAREHIATQTLLLEAIDVQTFCRSQMINAVLTICLRRADEAGLRVFHKINLPDKLETDEADVALLLSSILSNAITKSLQQESSARELSINLNHSNGQCALDVSFSLSVPLPLDEDGLPLTDATEPRGKDRLRDFMQCYDACAECSQRDGSVNLSMYWKDRRAHIIREEGDDA